MSRWQPPSSAVKVGRGCGMMDALAPPFGVVSSIIHNRCNEHSHHESRRAVLSNACQRNHAVTRQPGVHLPWFCKRVRE